MKDKRVGGGGTHTNPLHKLSFQFVGFRVTKGLITIYLPTGLLDDGVTFAEECDMVLILDDCGLCRFPSFFCVFVVLCGGGFGARL